MGAVVSLEGLTRCRDSVFAQNMELIICEALGTMCASNWCSVRTSTIFM